MNCFSPHLFKGHKLVSNCSNWSCVKKGKLFRLFIMEIFILLIVERVHYLRVCNHLIHLFLHILWITVKIKLLDLVKPVNQQTRSFTVLNYWFLLPFFLYRVCMNKIIFLKKVPKIESDLSGLTSWITLLNKIIPDHLDAFCSSRKVQ